MGVELRDVRDEGIGENWTPVNEIMPCHSVNMQIVWWKSELTNSISGEPNVLTLFSLFQMDL